MFDVTKAKVNSGWATPKELEYCLKSAKVINVIPKDVSVVLLSKEIEDQRIEELKGEFVKSKFMNNFIFNDKAKGRYVRYFERKLIPNSR